MYDTIQQQAQSAQGKVSVDRMCKLSGASRAGFYRDWEERGPKEFETEIRDRVQKIALKHRRYGYRRITALLRREGVEVGQRVVRRILRDDNLLAVGKRKFVVTTDSDHGFTVYPNLAQYVQVTAVNQLWVADITYLRLGQEFVYLAIVLDVFSRLVVGWELGRTLQASLPLAALKKAVASRNPKPGVVHHSDRGSQYASNDYIECAEEAKMFISMSKPACPWENGFCESFMNTLKSEQIDCRTFATLESLQQTIEVFIDQYYNKERLHSALGYCSPREFEEQAAATKAQPIALPAALSFPRHEEIYPDAREQR